MAKTNSLSNPPSGKDMSKSPSIDAEAQALIEEIDAEVKADQVKQFITRYGNTIAGLIVALILATAIGSTMSTMKLQQQEKDSEVLITMLDKDLDKTSADEVKATILDLGKMAREGKIGRAHV